MPTATKTLGITAAFVTIGLAVSGCSLLPDRAGHANGPYPQTIDSPYGAATIKDEPETIAVTSSSDLDIALALGADPVIAPADSGSKLSPWATEALDDADAAAPETYDAKQGPDLEAIRAAKPDVILATGLDDVGEHFDELSDIAPVVAADEDASWTDRTAAIATALNRAEAATEVVGDATSAAEEVSSHHLEFEDTTYALADVGKDSIDYLSYQGSDDSFFKGIGLLPDSTSQKYSATKHTLTREKVQDLDADILLIHFPAEGAGMLDKSELSDPYYREVKVIRGKHYTVIDDDTLTALTNLSPLSYEWLLDNLPSDLGKAEQGVL